MKLPTVRIRKGEDVRIVNVSDQDAWLSDGYKVVDEPKPEPEPEPDPAPEPYDFDRHPVPQLRAMAKDAGITAGTLDKAGLVKALQDSGWRPAD